MKRRGFFLSCKTRRYFARHFPYTFFGGLNRRISLLFPSLPRSLPFRDSFILTTEYLVKTGMNCEKNILKIDCSRGEIRRANLENRARSEIRQKFKVKFGRDRDGWRWSRSDDLWKEKIFKNYFPEKKETWKIWNRIGTLVRKRKSKIVRFHF